MDAKEVVIDDRTMEMLKEISEMYGTDMDDEVRKYHRYVNVGRKKLAEMGEMSPELAALCNFRIKVSNDYNWKKDIEDELYKKYIN